MLIEVVESNRFDLNHRGGRPRLDGDSRIVVHRECGVVGVFEGEREGGEDGRTQDGAGDGGSTMELCGFVIQGGFQSAL